MSEQDLYAAMLASMKEFQAQLCQTMRDWQTENRAAFTRLHERMDAQVEKETVSSPDCETRRTSCRSCMNQKIEKATGIPQWALAVGTIGGMMFGAMAIFIITKGAMLP